MKKLYTLLFALLAMAGFLWPSTARASHVMGSDISWKCIGKDSFQITIAAYRDCNGIQLSGGGIQLTPECGGSAINAGGALGDGLDITPTCDKSCTRCSNTGCEFQFGIQQFMITTTVVLSNYNCCKFKVSWGQCCRNGSITTGASGANFYCEALLDKCALPCDNSPYFVTPPIAIFCVNQCVVLNPGANDDDRNGNGVADSLVYKFTQPLSGPGSPIGYNAGYTYKTPLKYNGQDPDADFDPPHCRGFHLDAETGDLQFKATKTDITVVSMAIEEWRYDANGKASKIGEIRRDLQIAIIECPENRSPYVQTANNQTVFNFCAERSKCIQFNSFDPDTDDSTKLSWNNQIPGGEFKIEDEKAKWQKATFCWKPTKANVRSYPYRFVVTALDNACPIPARTAKTVSIYVKPPPEATYSAVVSDCGWVTFRAIKQGDVGIEEYTWTGEAPFGDRFYSKSAQYSFKYRSGGTYKYQLRITSKDGCETIYQDSVKVNPYVEVRLPNDSTVCKGSSFNIQSSRRYGKAPFTYKWSTGATTDNISVTVNKDTFYTVSILDGTGCDNFDTFKVKAKELPKPNLGPDKRYCKGDIITLRPNEKYLSKWEWYYVTPAGSSLIGTDSTLKVKDSGTYRVKVYDTLGCDGTDEVNLYFNPLVDVVKRTFQACRGDNITLSAGKGGTSWEWYDLTKPNKPPISYDSVFTLLGVSIDRYYRVVAKQTVMGVTCVDADTITLIVHQPNVPDAGTLPAQCIDNPPLNLQNYGTPRGGKWYFPAKGDAVLANNVYIKKLGVGSHWLTYEYTDINRCVRKDSALLVIDTLPTVEIGIDTIHLCSTDLQFDLTKSINPALSKLTPDGGTWSVVDKTIPIQGSIYPFIDPTDPKVVTGLGRPHALVYSYTNSSSAKCDNADTFYVYIHKTPVTQADPLGPLCEKQTPVILSGKPSGGTWKADTKFNPKTANGISFSGGLYRFNPDAATPGTHKLVYTVMADGKYCGKSDTATVVVNPTPNPTLSTEDGKASYCVTSPPVKLQFDQSGSVRYYMKAGEQGVIGSFFDPATAGVGKHTIFGDFTDKNQCKVTQNIEIEVLPEATVKIVSNQKLCKANNYVITATFTNAPGVTWEITDQGGGSATFVGPNNQPTVTVAATGLYFNIKATTSNATNYPCGNVSDEKQFLIQPLPVVDFKAPVARGCAPFAAELISTSTISEGSLVKFEWNFGDGQTSIKENPNHVYYKPGKYTVTLKVTSRDGCVDSAVKSQYIEVLETPEADFGARPQFTTIALPKIKFVNKSTSVYDDTKYEWNFGDQNSLNGGTSRDFEPEHKYSDTGMYTVKLIAMNQNGCRDTVEKINYIHIRPEIIVFIPNVFTPNERFSRETEGNEKFKAFISNYQSFELSVFNRWGEELFHTYDPLDGWDGTFRGRVSEEGVYVYVIKATSNSGKPYTFTGSVTLLR